MTAKPATAQPASRAEELALKLLVVLVRARNAVGAVTEADIASHGLTPGEFAVLETLHHKGPLLLGELQRKVLVSSGGVTYLVDRLAARGLVERLACPTDRRARYAGLTAEGRELMSAIFPAHRRAVVAAMAGLTAKEQAEAVRLLRKLGLGAAEVAGPPG